MLVVYYFSTWDEHLHPPNQATQIEHAFGMKRTLHPANQTFFEVDSVTTRAARVESENHTCGAKTVFFAHGLES